MTQHLINSSQHHLYNEFLTLYKASFPIFEQRNCKQQKQAFDDKRYHLVAYADGDEFIGFIAYWKFQSYRYVEHFAINTLLRGKGYGSKVLTRFVAAEKNPIILEIDPVVDEISRSRLRFYQKCGFLTNPHHHTHPPYNADYQPHPLVVLSSSHEISEKEYHTFYSDLCNVVMHSTGKQ